MQLKEAWIVGAMRTPVGRHGGSLSAVSPDDAGARVRRRDDVRYGLATMCIGVGQGIAMVVEKPA